MPLCTPHHWDDDEEEDFQYGLNILPPAASTPRYGAFLVGETYGSGANGDHTFAAYSKRNGEFFRSEEAIARQ